MNELRAVRKKFDSGKTTAKTSNTTVEEVKDETPKKEEAAPA